LIDKAADKRFALGRDGKMGGEKGLVSTKSRAELQRFSAKIG